MVILLPRLMCLEAILMFIEFPPYDANHSTLSYPAFLVFIPVQ